MRNIEPPHHRDITIELTQHAFMVAGISTKMAKTDQIPGDRVRSCDVHGRIHNRFLSLTGNPTDSKRLGDIHYLLEITGDGQTMVGWCKAYSKDKTIGLRCMLVRRDDAKTSASKADNTP